MQCVAAPRKHKPPHSTLTAVAIFDGLFEGVNAMRALARLNDTLDSHVTLHRLAWSFDNLQRLDVRHMSVRKAAEADVIIVAAPGDHSLPAHAKSWLSRIRREQVRPLAALIVLHDDERHRLHGSLPSPLCTELNDLAHRWQCEFLCNSDFEQRLSDGLGREIMQRRVMDRPKDDNEEDPVFTATRWGINE